MSTTTHQGAEGAETMTAAERVCHEEQMVIWSGEVVGRLNMGGCFRDDLTYDDLLEINAAISEEIRSIVGSAFDLSTPAPRTDGGMAAGEDANFGDAPHDLVGEIATQVLNLPWTRLGLTDPRSGHFDHDALADRHGDVQIIAEKALRDARASDAESAWPFERTRAYLLAELERLRADLHTIGEDLTGEQGKAASWLDVATGRVANVASVLASATPAQPAGAVPDSLRALSEAVIAASAVSTVERLENAAVGGLFHCEADREEAVEIITEAIRNAAQPAGQSAGSGAETDALVDRFSAALKVKLRAAEAKYGWKNGWLKSDWQVECQNGLLRHVGKGDPLDVAAYAAFCWHHGWPSASRRSTDLVTGAVIPTAGAIAAYETRYPDGSLSETSDNTIEAWNRVAAAVCLAEKPAPDSARTGDEGTGAREIIPFKANYRHKKTGGLYQTLDVVTNGTNGEADGQKMVLYTNGMKSFVREYSEFFDGRFERIQSADALAARPAAPEAWTRTGSSRVPIGFGPGEWEWFRASDGVLRNYPAGFNPNSGRYEGLTITPAPPASSGQGGR